MDTFVTSRFQGALLKPEPLKPDLANPATFRVSHLPVSIKACRGPTVPKALCILLRVWAYNYRYGVDMTGRELPISDVYTLLAIGIGLFENFAKGQLIVMRHIDTFNAIGKMSVLLKNPAPTPPFPITDAIACGDLSMDFAVPFDSLIGNGSQVLQPAFARYLDQLRGTLSRYDIGKATYPGGKPWTWQKEHPKAIRHPFGDIPMALFLYNRSQTRISIKEVDGFVSNLLYRVLIEQGLTMTDYYKQPPLVMTMLAARLLRQITLLLRDYPDYFGESWTMPMAEATLTRASIDCEELATLSAMAFRSLMATSDDCKLCQPLKNLVKRHYIGLHVLCLARFGPSKDPRGERSQLWMHVNYALMHRRLFASLCRAENAATAPLRLELPGYILVEGSDDTQSHPRLKQLRPGLDYHEIEAIDSPHVQTLGSFISWEAERKYHYYQDVVGFFDTDDPTRTGPTFKAPIDLTPLQNHADTGGRSWGIGIAIADLLEGRVERNPSEYRLQAGPSIDEKTWRLASMYARLYSDKCNLGFDPQKAIQCGHSVLDGKQADALVARANQVDDTVLRVTFCAFDEKFRNCGLPMQARVDAALKSVHAFGHRTHNSIYQTLDAKLLCEDLFYSGEGLPPAYCVMMTRGKEGKKDQQHTETKDTRFTKPLRPLVSLKSTAVHSQTTTVSPSQLRPLPPLRLPDQARRPGRAQRPTKPKQRLNPSPPQLRKEKAPSESE